MFGRFGKGKEDSGKPAVATNVASTPSATPQTPHPQQAAHSSSAPRSEEKRAQQLTKFMDKERPAGNRLKHAMQYIDGATESVTSKFCNDNYAEIWTVFKDFFNSFITLQPAKKAPVVSELVEYLDLLKKLFDTCAQFEKKYEMKAILDMIRDLLAITNKPEVRTKGAEVYAHYLHALGPSVEREPAVIGLLSEAIAFEPFLADFGTKASQIKLPVRNETKGTNMPQPPDATMVLPISNGSTPVTQEDSALVLNAILQNLLTSTTPARERNCVFWLSLLKRRILSILYPEVCKKIGAMEDTDARGFPWCPQKLQVVVTQHLSEWLRLPMLFSALCSSTENMQLILEICRQSMRVPLAFSVSIHNALDIYRGWIEGVNRAPIMNKESWPGYLQTFLQHLALPFYTMPVSSTLADHTKLIRDLLAVFRFCALEKIEKYSPETWTVLLDTVLDFTHHMFADTHPKNQNSILTKEVGEEILEGFFLCWLQSGVVRDDRWATVSLKMAAWTHWPVVVRQWRRVLQMAAGAGIEHLWNIPACPDGECGEVKRKLTSMGLVGLTVKWDVVYSHAICKQLLGCLGPICDIAEAKCKVDALTALIDTLALLLSFNTSIPPEVKNSLPPPLLRLFGPTFFIGCAKRENMDEESKALCFRGAAMLLSRPDAISTAAYGSLYAEYNSNYLRVLHDGLLTQSVLVIESIVKSTTAIFSSPSVVGAVSLVPDYLNALMFLATKRSADTEVRRGLVTILASMVCLPDLLHSTPISAYDANGTATPFVVASIPARICEIVNAFLLKEDEAPLAAAAVGVLTVVAANLARSENALQQKEVLFSCTREVLGQLTHEKSVVALAACDCVIGLVVHAQKAPEQLGLDVMIVDGLCAAVVWYFRDQRKLRERVPVVEHLFNAVQEWLMAFPKLLSSNVSIKQKFGDIILCGLSGEAPSAPSGERKKESDAERV
eukprot:TRINITY_DN1548_c0_g1_i5.p1 TRINITY_DN1548_c0_g1~~TRINITY_DN1548_c0_g1_i5.p1  ORF type:complete len:952 (+),score=238.46 TRINITY_DN1548_c0_g1_i5:1-2856(+)